MKRRILWTCLLACILSVALMAAAYAYPAISPTSPGTAVISTPGDTAYFSFTPTVSGWYTFYSECEYDTVGWIYDDITDEVIEDDDNGFDNNFRVELKLEADHEYTLGARLYNNARTGTFQVYLRASNGLQLNYGDNCTDSMQVVPGASVTLEAVGTCEAGEIHYRWEKAEYDPDTGNYYDFNDLPGETSPQLEIESLTMHSVFVCFATDDFGSSKELYFSVAIDNDFNVREVGSKEKTVLKGQSVSMEVSARCNTGSIRYQWFSDWGQLEGERGNTCTAENVMEPCTYQCVVLDQYGNREDIYFYIRLEKDLSRVPMLSLDKRVSIAPANGELAYFRFVAPYTGTYMFYSERPAGSSTDPYGYQVDKYGTVLQSNDDDDYGDEGERNFRIYCELTKDSTYYFAAGHCEEDDNGRYNVAISVVPYLVSAAPDGPYDYVVEMGDTVTLKVVPTVSGTIAQAGLVYSWEQYDSDEQEWVSIPGAASSSYTTGAITENNIEFRCSVNDKWMDDNNICRVYFYIRADSDLTVEHVGADTRKVVEGSTVNLSVNAYTRQGSTGLRYEWYCDDALIEEDGFAAAAITTFPVEYACTYSCYVYDQHGCYDHVDYYLMLDDLTVSINDGHGVSVPYGTKATLTAAAESATNDELSYQWYQYSEDTLSFEYIQNATDNVYITDAITKTTSFECKVTDQHNHSEWASCDVTINNGFTLTRVGARDRVVRCKDPLRFEVRATCNQGPLTYQWSKTIYDENDQAQTEEIPTVTGNILTLEHIESNDMYIECVVTDPYGAVLSTDFEAYLSQSDNGHLEVTTPAVAPTCVNSGWTEEIHCAVCGEILQYSYEIYPLGHNWSRSVYMPTDSFSFVTASRHCSVCGCDEEETKALTLEATPASCEKEGKVAYTATFENPAFSPQEYVMETTPATGHDWEEPNYVWSDDLTSVTATHVCRTNAAHEESETAWVIDYYTTDATCTEPEKAILIAEPFENPAFSDQTYTIVNDGTETGHDWSEPTYDWAEDYSTVTGTRICQNDPSHIETETVEATAVYEENADCDTEGFVRYTSDSFEKDGFEQQTTEVIRPAGHDWSRPTYVWAGDLSEVTASHTCRRCGANETAIADSIDIDDTSDPATCEAPGTIIYTAVFDIPDIPAFITQTKSVAAAALGHDWDNDGIVYTWANDYSTATAVKSCRNDPSHTIQETVRTVADKSNLPTCENPGQIVYTATFTMEGTVVQTETVQLDALGHDYRIEYVWESDCSHVTGIRTCRNDITERIEEQVETESEDGRPATCTQSGQTVFTSKDFTSRDEDGEPIFSKQTKTVNSAAKKPHTLDKHDEVIDACGGGTDAYWECTVCGNLFEDSNGTREIAAPPAIVGGGHDWGDATYSWSADYSTCTAKHTCLRNAAHVETENGRITTESSGGRFYFIATFSKAGFSQQRREANFQPGSFSDSSGNYTIEAGGAVYKGPKKDQATVKIPDTINVNGVNVPVYKIANKAFKGKKKLKTITIGANIKEIGTSAFEGCKKLKTVKGGDNVEKIGDKAYKGCVALTKYTIGAKVNSIGKNAFNGCTKLKTITVKSELLTSSNVKSGAFKKISAKATFKVPKAKKKEYAKFLPKKGTKTVKVK